MSQSFLSRLLGRSPVTRYEKEFPKLGEEIPCNDSFSIVLRGFRQSLPIFGHDTPERWYAVLLKGPCRRKWCGECRKNELDLPFDALSPEYKCTAIQPDGTAALDTIKVGEAALDELHALAERVRKHGLTLPVDAIYSIMARDLKAQAAASDVGEESIAMAAIGRLCPPHGSPPTVSGTARPIRGRRAVRPARVTGTTLLGEIGAAMATPSDGSPGCSFVSETSLSTALAAEADPHLHLCLHRISESLYQCPRLSSRMVPSSPDGSQRLAVRGKGDGTDGLTRPLEAEYLPALVPCLACLQNPDGPV